MPRRAPSHHSRHHLFEPVRAWRKGPKPIFLPIVEILSIVLLAVVPGDPGWGREKMYWTTFSAGDKTVERADLDGTNIELLVSGLISPGGLDLDTNRGKVYWAEQNGRRLARANLDGSGVETILGSLPGFPASVALDVDAEKIYWVEFAGSTTHSVKRANLDGSNLENLVFLDLQGNRNGIALDLEAGKIYWTLCVGIIRRSNLDGSAVEDLLSGLGCLGEIAVDPAGGKLYWADAASGDPRIQRSNLDGTDLEDLVVTGLDQPIGIAVDAEAGHLYWADRGAQRIQRSHLDGTGVIDIVTGIEGFWGIALDTTPIFGDGFETGDTSAWR
ncbi:MAG: hypothetical protein MI919_36245 [Holophagales bacterium]|nr:hypothetical protein [Holophagales bacterium]